MQAGSLRCCRTSAYRAGRECRERVETKAHKRLASTDALTALPTARAGARCGCRSSSSTISWPPSGTSVPWGLGWLASCGRCCAAVVEPCSPTSCPSGSIQCSACMRLETTTTGAAWLYQSLRGESLPPACSKDFGLVTAHSVPRPSGCCMQQIGMPFLWEAVTQCAALPVQHFACMCHLCTAQGKQPVCA